jgi:GxxExxY protein
MERNDLTGRIIGAAIEVHRSLGPGLLESAYEECLAHELQVNRVPFSRQQGLPVEYKGVRLGCGYRIDLLVGGIVVVEVKSIAGIEIVHEAQLLTYMRLSGCPIGLLINFNVATLRDGIRRRVL